MRRWSALFVVFCSVLFFQSCYTIRQGYFQLRLLLQREDLQSVIDQRNESEERLALLAVVPDILRYAREMVGLDTGYSYTTYIRLDRPVVTYLVQAAEKRRLQRKTWWFPFVGEQPYLGFFHKADADALASDLAAEGYDVRQGGATAFSLLGYFPDPLYSSMIDGRELADIVDLLIHECLHRTLYIPGSSTFNESLADFVAKKATIAFLEERLTDPLEVERFEQTYRKEVRVSRMFKVFLEDAKKKLVAFYDRAADDLTLQDDGAFLAARRHVFLELEEEYTARMRAEASGTWYERAFRADTLNNAVVLAYSLYEARPEPFEQALEMADGNLPRFIGNLKVCFEGQDDLSEEEMWELVSNCDGSGATSMQRK
jgi:predicted aminopeptidase